MTYTEMNELVDARTQSTREGLVAMHGWLVAVRVLDARSNFGRVDVLVTPITGNGERWIDLERVQGAVKP